MICDNCPNYINRGPNIVPWGNTMVNEGDVWECDLERDPCVCAAEADEPHYALRSYNRADEDDMEWGDIQGHMAREDGR